MTQSLTQDVVDQHVKVPAVGQKIYNDECVYSFDTAKSPEGIFVSLRNFLAVGRTQLEWHHSHTGDRVYLQIKHTEVPKPVKDEEAPSKLQIGGDGGFNPDNVFDVEKAYNIVLLPEFIVVPLTEPGLPGTIVQVADTVIAAASANTVTEANWSADDVPLIESKYARNLEQVHNGKRISPDPKSWKCEESGKTENLWLNLSTGFIGSGRRNWDGSGGTGAALKHFQDTGSKYPLAVKLGTITASGADVYSYAPDEDDMVKDPLLAEHLAFWGINIMDLQKTEKTVAEMEVELNRSFEFDRILESGAKLEPLSGAGLIGLKNLGNTCYLASVMQVMFSIHEFARRYNNDEVALQVRSMSQDVTADGIFQLCKLGNGLLTDRYAIVDPQNALEHPVPNVEWVEPRSFKHVIGSGHPEFSSAGQQDAAEFFQYFLDWLERQERSNIIVQTLKPLADIFAFTTQRRLQCHQSNKVSYSKSLHNVLTIPIPVELADNASEVDRASKKPRMEGDQEEAEVLPKVSIESCLQRFFAPSELSDFTSPATGIKGKATISQRLVTFPKYLPIVLSRYVLGEDWTPKKILAEVPFPDVIDLSSFQVAEGLQEGEQELEDAAPKQEAPAAPSPDEAIVAQVAAMGFSENAAKRAAIAVSNAGSEQAMEWLFGHLEDADINDPPVPPAAGSAAGGSKPTASADGMAMLSAMGFDGSKAEFALLKFSNNVEQAADWLFSAGDAGIEAAIAEAKAAEQKGNSSGDVELKGQADFDGTYELFALVSHLGRNTSSGHYVCHIKKDGRWVIFNDRKVALSSSPPKDVAYMAFYKARQHRPEQA